MDGSVIQILPELKILGLIFDSKFTWISHITDLVTRAKKALNVIRCLSNIKWGADREVLLQLYSSLVLSKLDYGAVVYSSARPSRLKNLDPVHSSGIRMSIGAFRTSPVLSMCCDAGTPPLKYRRDKLLLNYTCKIWSLPDHPVYQLIFENNDIHQKFEARPTITRPVSVRTRELMAKLDIILPTVYPQGFSETPPWTISTPACNTDLTMYKKGETNNIIIRSTFYNILLSFPQTVKIYTDGSKSEVGVGSAFTVNGESHSWRLPSMASIFTAELYAIWQALKHIENTNINKVLIITDSLSSIEVLKNTFNENTLAQRILALVEQLSTINKIVSFMWCPGHIGVEGNETADSFARQAVNSGVIEDIPITSMDIRNNINQSITNNWQLQWNRTEAKLKSIKPDVEKWTFPSKTTRREQVVLTRLRIGHTHLTSLYLLRGEGQPICATCNQPLTVRHVLLYCAETNEYRELLRIPDSLKLLLGNKDGEIRRALEFLRMSGVFYKI